MLPSNNKFKKHIGKAKKLPKYLEKRKIDEILERARYHNKRNYLILLTLWRTKIRNSELVNLKNGMLSKTNLILGKAKVTKVGLYHLTTTFLTFYNWKYLLNQLF